MTAGKTGSHSDPTTNDVGLRCTAHQKLRRSQATSKTPRRRLYPGYYEHRAESADEKERRLRGLVSK
jgi:hypothetical protein